MPYFHPTFQSAVPFIRKNGFPSAASLRRVGTRVANEPTRTLVFDTPERADSWYRGANGVIPAIIQIDGDVLVEEKGNLHLLEGMHFLTGEIPVNQVSVHPLTAINGLMADVNQISEVKRGIVQLDLINRPKGGVEIFALWSHVERGKGHATNVMKAFFELADQHDVDIWAEPCSLHYDIATRDLEGASDEELDLCIKLNKQGLNDEELLAWYQKLGFELTGTLLGDNPEIVRRANAPVLKLG